MRLLHLALALALTSALTAPLHATHHTPRLTLELRSLGFTPTRYDGFEGRYLAFNQAGEILLAANSRDQSRLSTTFHTTLLLVHAADGTVLQRAAIPNTKRWGDVFLVSGDRLLVCDEKKINVYSSSLRPEKEVDLPTGVTGCGSYLSVSPSRNRFYVWRRGRTAAVISAEDFSISENSCGPGEKGVLGDAVVACVAKAPRRVRVSGSDPPQYYGEDLLREGNDNAFTSVYFINDSALLIATGKRLAVFDRAGHAVCEAASGDKAFFQTAGAIAPTAHRFAVMRREMRGVNAPSLDVYAAPSDFAVDVYDYTAPSPSPVFTQAVEGFNPWPFGGEHQNTGALSADGKQLAILTDTTLRLYDLP